jgi:hypothetical protein
MFHPSIEVRFNAGDPLSALADFLRSSRGAVMSIAGARAQQKIARNANF